MILVIIFKAIVFWLAVGSAVWEQTSSSEDKHWFLHIVDVSS